MPRQKDLKRLVRARMAKTGETYTSARSAIAGPVRGHEPTESDSAALAYALQSLGVTNPATDAPFAVHELFGIGGGIGFAYFTFQYPEFTSVFTGCRINDFVLKSDLIGSTCTALGIEHQVHTTTSGKVAETQLQRAWDDGACAIVTIDRTHLPDLGLSGELAGMMPATVVVEPAGDAVRVTDGRRPAMFSHADLAEARRAIPSQKHRLVTLAAERVEDVSHAVDAGIAQARRGMLEPPKANFGVAGLRKWRDLVDAPGKRGWSQLFATESAREEAVTWVQFWISEDGVGAGYRTLYADFLDFAAHRTRRSELKRVAAGYRDVGALWRRLAVLESADLPAMAAVLDELVQHESELAAHL